MPALAAKGVSANFSKEFIEEKFALKEDKVSPHLLDVENITVCSEECADVFQILRPLGIIDHRLELESDQSLGTDNSQFPQSGIEFCRIVEQTTCDRSTRKQEIDAFVTPNVVCGVSTAMQAPITELQ